MASVVIGVVGAWVQGSRLRVLRLVTQGYIQFFRNTPPLVQLYFFYFALGSYLKITGANGIAVPIVSNFTWAAICLSFYAGAFNVEIFRAGIEAVPRETLEAAESLGYSRLKAYVYVILPLAFRISLPALNNNLVNLIKTTTIAYAIAVPEMLYVANQIWSDESNVPEMMNVLLVIYVAPGRPAGLGHGTLGARAPHSGIYARMIAQRKRGGLPSPLRGGVGGGGQRRVEQSRPPSLTLPLKGGGNRHAFAAQQQTDLPVLKPFRLRGRRTVALLALARRRARGRIDCCRRHRRGAGSAGHPRHHRHHPEMDAAAGAGLRAQHRDELSRDGDRHRGRRAARPRADLAAAAGARRRPGW